jgi:hypothetical protein
MKTFAMLLLALFSVAVNGQETMPEFDGHKWEAPYNLPIPKDWGIERFLIPISFAPQIPYKGVEDIRFAPGWGKVNSDEYWTYAFLWYLEGSPQIDASVIAGNLKAYYTGLIEINRSRDSIPAATLSPVLTLFTETTTEKGDLKTYTGTIEMTDYMQHKPIMLNCIAHWKFCPDEKRTILYFALSPKPVTHANWLILNQLWQDFNCKKEEAISK